MVVNMIRAKISLCHKKQENGDLYNIASGLLTTVQSHHVFNPVYLVEEPRGWEGVSGAQQHEKVMSPKIVANKVEQCDPHVGLHERVSEWAGEWMSE